MKVKVCGITSVEDAVMCEDLGADALGFVHVEGRARSRPLEDIANMCASLGPMTTRVLVCAPKNATEAERMFVATDADMLQLHSLEPQSLDILMSHGIPVIRSVAPDRAEAERFADHADMLLFEGAMPGIGSSYDYTKVPVGSCKRCVIAGGLNVTNMDAALKMRPYALDVSSGVERSPGRKDKDLVSEFIWRCKG